jgi:hypothetical protein
VTNATAGAALAAAGLFHLAFAIFHLTFWKVFRWREELPRLGFINRAVMQILNLRLTYLFFVFSGLMLALPEEMLGTRLGMALLAAISVGWVMRAVEQVVFFGVRNATSAAFTLLFLVGAALPAIALLAR